MKPEDVLIYERSVLGGMMRWPACIGEVVGIVRRESFYTDAHQKIFAAIIAVWDANKPVDTASVAEALHRKGEIADIGNYQCLADLWDHEPTGANAVYHARMVRDRGLVRRLGHAANEILRDVKEAQAPAEDLLAGAEKAIFALAESGLSGDAVPLRPTFEESFDRYDQRHGGGIGGLPTGLIDLDRKLGGLHDGELVVLAARPGLGKSALANTITLSVAKGGAAVFFSSLEMSRGEIADRLICAEARVPLHCWRLGMCDQRQIAAATASRAHLLGLPIHADDRPTQSMCSIAANARRLKRQKDIKLVVVDYLQLVDPEDHKAQRHEQVSAISRRLKGLAKELALPVLALAQLNRAGDGGRPRLAQLRESGGIEADADVVVLLHRPEEGGQIVEADVAKNRNGPTGSVSLIFESQYVRFGNYAGPDLGDVA